jgi:mRNA interferase RelE/StbE
MSYAVLIYPSAQRSLDAIPMPAHQAVLDAMLALGAEARPHGCTKLTDREAWRIRIGRYRVIYEVDDAKRTVTVTNVGHRRDIYRG